MTISHSMTRVLFAAVLLLAGCPADPPRDDVGVTHDAGAQYDTGATKLGMVGLRGPQGPTGAAGAAGSNATVTVDGGILSTTKFDGGVYLSASGALPVASPAATGAGTITLTDTTNSVEFPWTITHAFSSGSPTQGGGIGTATVGTGTNYKLPNSTGATTEGVRTYATWETLAQNESAYYVDLLSRDGTFRTAFIAFNFSNATWISFPGTGSVAITGTLNANGQHNSAGIAYGSPPASLSTVQASDSTFSSSNAMWVNGATEVLFSIGGTSKGNLQSFGMSWSSRFMNAKGANVAIAQPLTLGTDGNFFTITGSGTVINGIVTTSWQAGACVTLSFSSTTSNTVTHNSGSPGTSAVAIKLNGAANFTSGTGGFSTLSLCYDGTFWREVGRSVG